MLAPSYIMSICGDFDASCIAREAIISFKWPASDENPVSDGDGQALSYGTTR